MCTIGNSFWNAEGLLFNTVFKQCDLVDKTTFLNPVKQTSKSGIDYVAFTRQKGDITPAWAGVNQYGVCFVAADSYLKKNEKGLWMKKENGPTVFDMYLKIITDFKTAREATEMAKEFYKNVGYSDDMTDILMIADSHEILFIETLNKDVRIVKRTNGHFVSTNHCRMFYGTAPYDQNHSTFLRLNRAEALLNKRDDNTGIGDLLRDSYYGKTVWSICRYASVTDADLETAKSTDEDMFYTQACVMFTIKPNGDNLPVVACEFVTNGNAKDKEGFIWYPFEKGEPSKELYIGYNENLWA